ncbi:MAG: hypothetical protein IJU08_03020 [Bacteroidales bacterium]|nr:hypothetical protein [Bacteroidales bacterium]MBQ9397447.1 hypothetical protein [Bacteroidales bacterium]
MDNNEIIEMTRFFGEVERISITVNSEDNEIEVNGKISRNIACLPEEEVRCKLVTTLLEGVLAVCPKEMTKEEFMTMCDTLFDYFKNMHINTGIAFVPRKKDGEWVN